MEVKFKDKREDEIVSETREKLKKEQNKILIGFAIIFLVGYTFFFTSNLWMPRSYEDARVTEIGSSIEANERKITLISWTYCEEKHTMEVVLEIVNTSLDGIEEYLFTAYDKDEGRCEVEKRIDKSDLVVLDISKVPSRWTSISLRMNAESGNTNTETENFDTIRLYTSKRVIDRVDDISPKSEKEYRTISCNLKIEKFNEEIEVALSEIKECEETISSADKRIDELNAKLEYETKDEKAETLSQIASITSAKESANLTKQAKEDLIRQLSEKIDMQNAIKESL